MMGHPDHARASSGHTPVRPLTATGLWVWLRRAAPVRRAAPGESLVYWQGLLARDRAPGSRLDKRMRARLDRLVAEAQAAGETGLVHLVQRRVGAGVCAYLAIRSRQPILRTRADPPPPTSSKEPSMKRPGATTTIEEAS